MENPSDKPIIYIGGLDDQVDEKTLHSAFVPFGEIKTIEMPLDHTTGKNYLIRLLKINIERHKGFGFIEYEEFEDCLHAIENMNDAELFGRVLRVNFARPQRFKEGYYKPIWMEEEYNKKDLKEEKRDDKGKAKLPKQEKMFFA